MVCSERNKIRFLLSESVVNLQFNLLEMEKINNKIEQKSYYSSIFKGLTQTVP